jgi:hypothetical protein
MIAAHSSVAAAMRLGTCGAVVGAGDVQADGLEEFS